MREKKTEMYIIAAIATAAKDNPKYPEGERHGALIFVRTTSHDDAAIIAGHKMYESGWSSTRVDKTGVVPDVRQEGSDPVSDAQNSAYDTGFGVVVYPNIVP